MKRVGKEITNRPKMSVTEALIKIGFPKRLLDELLDNRAFCTCHFDDGEMAIPVIKKSAAEAGYMIDNIEKHHVHKEPEVIDVNIDNSVEQDLFENGEEHHEAKIEDYSISVSGNFEGQITQYSLNKTTLSSIDFLNMYELRKSLRVLEKFPIKVVNSKNETRVEETIEEVNSFKELLDFANSFGRKGLTVQRYKGLGEMNPEQLWSTTMNPEKRTLYKVDIEDAVGADNIFTILMGDEVEPRRKFIQENAFNVRNLDI